MVCNGSLLGVRWGSDRDRTGHGGSDLTAPWDINEPGSSRGARVAKALLARTQAGHSAMPTEP